MTAKNVDGNELAPIEQDVTFSDMEIKLFEKIHTSIQFITNIEVEIFEKYLAMLKTEKNIEEDSAKYARVNTRIVQLELLIALKKSGF